MAWHNLNGLEALFLGQDIIVLARRTPSDRCVVTFTSRVEQMESAPPPPFEYEALRQANCGFVGVISTRNHWWQTPEFGPAMARIRDWLDTHDFDEILGYGDSMGGVGVLCAAQKLNLDTAVVVGAEYDISPDTVSWDTRWHEDSRNLGVSFAKAMDKGAPETTQVVYIHDPFNLDRRHFRLLSSSFRIVPLSLAFSGHEVFPCLKEAGMADDALRWLLLGRAPMATRIIRVINAYRAHRGVSPRFWQGVIEVAMRHGKSGLRDLAIDRLSALGKLDLKSTHVIGAALLHDGKKPEAAQTFYDAGIGLLPGHPASWRGKVNCLHAMGRDDLAVEMAIGALARRPKSVDLCRVLLVAAHRVGNEALRGVAAAWLVSLSKAETESDLFLRFGGPDGLSYAQKDPGLLGCFETALTTIVRRRPNRYSQIYQHLVSRSPRSLVEVGVFDGRNAAWMIAAANALASSDAPAIKYTGYDLFEEMTAEVHAAELSKLPLSLVDVEKKLATTNAEIILVKGYTQDTLPGLAAAMHKGREGPEFVFLDGGHHIETIRSDWANISLTLGPGAVVIFDDFYVDRPADIGSFGCNDLIAELSRDPNYRVDLLPVVDQFEKDFGILKVAMVRVERLLVQEEAP